MIEAWSVYSLAGQRRQTGSDEWMAGPGTVYRGGTNREPDLRRYLLPGGWEALVGRGDADNDALSLKVAAPGDYWFHVRGMPGSHVILRRASAREAPAEPDRATLKAAAALAAYFSKARGGGVVAVSCTRARYVTKPRGAPRGTVQIRKEIVLKVRPGLGEAQAAPRDPAG